MRALSPDNEALLRKVAAAFGDAGAETDDIMALAGRIDLEWNALMGTLIYTFDGDYRVPDVQALGQLADTVDWAQFRHAEASPQVSTELREEGQKNAAYLREIRINLALASLTKNDGPVLVHMLAAALMHNSQEAAEQVPQIKEHLRSALGKL